MIKFALAALWISAVTAGSVYYAFTAARNEAAAAPPPPYFGGLDYVKTDVISVPVFADGAVHGYFLTRLVYTVEPARLKALTIPAPALISDQVYSYLYANPQIDFTHKERLDLNAFRAALRDGINKKLGADLIHEIIVEQIDYLTKADIRDNTLRRRTDSGPPPNRSSEGDAQPGGH